MKFNYIRLQEGNSPSHLIESGFIKIQRGEENIQTDQEKEAAKVLLLQEATI